MSKLEPKYGEPWELTEEGYIVDCRGCEDCTMDDEARIVACVNAFAGVDDPAAEMERLRALLARLNDVALALKIAKSCHDTIHDAEEWCDTCGIRADGIAAYRNAVRGVGGTP